MPKNVSCRGFSRKVAGEELKNLSIQVYGSNKTNQSSPCSLPLGARCRLRSSLVLPRRSARRSSLRCSLRSSSRRGTGRSTRVLQSLRGLAVAVVHLPAQRAGTCTCSCRTVLFSAVRTALQLLRLLLLRRWRFSLCCSRWRLLLLRRCSSLCCSLHRQQGEKRDTTGD